MDQPDFPSFTDRQWSIYATSQATKAITQAGDLTDRHNNIVADQRTLLTLIDQLTAELAEMKETVALLVALIVERHGRAPICKMKGQLYKNFQLTVFRVFFSFPTVETQ